MSNSVLDEIRDSLNGRPGQPIVFGVCRSLAEKFNQEPWVFRAAAILLGLFFTLATVGIYIILGFALKETEDRTRRFFSGLAILVREWTEKLADSLRSIFGPERA